jgi:hypothetical protein
MNGNSIQGQAVKHLMMRERFFGGTPDGKTISNRQRMNLICSGSSMK